MSTTSHAHPIASESIVRIALNLTMVALVSGLILAVINHFTQPIRIANEEAMRREAQRSVAPKRAESFEAIPGFAKEKAWYRGKDQAGNTVGYVLPVKTRGYEGFIEMMLGVDAAQKIVDFVIIQDKETPGLGALAREKPFRDKFAGRTVERLEVSPKPEGDKIVAITGATITSRAVAKGLRGALETLKTLEADQFRTIPPALAHSEEGHE
jgi:electron transport complex protein RnfG